MSHSIIQMVYMLLMFNSMISMCNHVMLESDSKISKYDCAVLHGVYKNGKIKIPYFFESFFLFSSNSVTSLCNSVISMFDSLK